MAKSENQKLKLTALSNILLRLSDAKHQLTTQEMISELEKEGISAERKSIYNDLKVLEERGMDIVSETKGKYYVASRNYELAELKVLVDVVQASNFLTEKKSNELIKKLENETSVYEAKKLQRNVFTANRLKSGNESVLYNVDTIYNAISENKKIVFKYCEWTLKRELVPKKDGADYVISPWYLIWDDENYYLVGYDEEAAQVKYYRVDKMKELSLSDSDRVGNDKMKNFDVAAFCKATFGMYDGKEGKVYIKFPNKFVGVVIDRFGKDVTIKPIDDEYFEARVDAKVSGQFFGWIVGLGKEIEIIGPADVRKEFKAYIADISKNYK